MRAIWKGAVSFGLVSVPVKLYSATESHDVSFRQVHAKDGGRIKYQRVCAIDGEEVAYADIAKGYETEDGEMVILSDEDMADLPVTSSREIAVEKFVPRDQIDPMLLEKSYYLEPEKTGAKPYALLRQALIDADRMAVVTVALRQRTSIAVLRVKDDVIVLQTMMWPDEVRVPDFSVEVGEIKDAEVKMAHMLVDTLAGDFDASEFEDDYADAVQEMVKAKIEGGEVKRTPTATKSSGEVVDLLAALQKSVAAAKEARGEDSGKDYRPRSPPRRRAAKKTASQESPPPRSRRPRRPPRRRPPPRRPADARRPPDRGRPRVDLPRTDLVPGRAGVGTMDDPSNPRTESPHAHLHSSSRSGHRDAGRARSGGTRHRGSGRRLGRDRAGLRQRAHLQRHGRRQRRLHTGPRPRQRFHPRCRPPSARSTGASRAPPGPCSRSSPTRRPPREARRNLGPPRPRARSRSRRPASTRSSVRWSRSA